MFIELMIIIILSFDSLLRHHDAQQYTPILLQSISLLQILKCKITDELKFDGDVGCVEDLHDACTLRDYLPVISGPIPIPGIRVTDWC